MKQIYNPYLPLNEYIPDGEPHVFDGRLYIFGSHDRENGGEFCELDYVCYSAAIDDLTKWRFEGTIYRRDQDPDNSDGSLCLYAPDVCHGPDGRYYLYYCLKFCDFISIAVCDTPAGKYEYYGKVVYPDGSLLGENLPYDPAVLVEEGRVLLYYGFAPTTLQIPKYKGLKMPGGSAVELESDMCTVKDGPRVVLPSALYGKGTSFEGHEYFEAPSIRKIGELYYLVYSSVHAHELCYAVSRDPLGGFEYGGVIVSNGDIGYKGRKTEDRLMAIGNNHGGLVCVKDQWYIFYHRHTHTNAYNRQGCAEPVHIDENGRIRQVTITTSGLNNGPLAGLGMYPAVICCNLTNGRMPMMPSKGRGNEAEEFPNITNQGDKRFLTGIKDKTVIGYKYITLCQASRITVKYRGCASGTLFAGSERNVKSILKALNNTAQFIVNNPAAACHGDEKWPGIRIGPNDEWVDAETEIHFGEGERELYFVYHGSGELDMLSFTLLPERQA